MEPLGQVFNQEQAQQIVALLSEHELDAVLAEISGEEEPAFEIKLALEHHDKAFQLISDIELSEPIEIAGKPIVEDIIRQSIGMIGAIRSGDVSKVVLALASFAGFIRGINSPVQEPLTRVLQRIVNQAVSESWVDKFKTNLQANVTYFKLDYFPHRVPREQLSPDKIEANFRHLRAKGEEVLKIRDNSSASSLACIGLPTYIAAQNTLLMILDERAQYDVKETDKKKTIIYTKTIPGLVEQAIEHVMVTFKKLARARRQKVKERSKLSHGNRYYWVVDEQTGFASAKTKDHRSRLKDYADGLRNLVEDELYEQLNIRETLAHWHSFLTDEPIPEPALTFERLPITDKDWLWSDRGTGALDSIRIYRPKIPKDYHLLGDYATRSLKPGATLLAVKENIKGALAPPTGFIQMWNDKRTGGVHDGALWRPLPPPGYVPLGYLCTKGYQTPSIDQMMCVRRELVSRTFTWPLWDSLGAGGRHKCTVWTLSNTAPFPSHSFLVTDGIHSRQSFWGSWARNHVYQIRALRWNQKTDWFQWQHLHKGDNRTVTSVTNGFVGGQFALRGGSLFKIVTALNRWGPFGSSHWNESAVLFFFRNRLFIQNEDAMHEVDKKGKSKKVGSYNWKNTTHLVVSDDAIYSIQANGLYSTNRADGRPHPLGADSWPDSVAMCVHKHRLFILSQGALWEVSLTTGKRTRVGEDNWTGAKGMLSTELMFLDYLLIQMPSGCFLYNPNTGKKRKPAGPKWENARLVCATRDGIELVNSKGYWRLTCP